MKKKYYDYRIIILLAEKVLGVFAYFLISVKRKYIRAPAPYIFCSGAAALASPIRRSRPTLHIICIVSVFSHAVHVTKTAIRAGPRNDPTPPRRGSRRKPPRVKSSVRSIVYGKQWSTKKLYDCMNGQGSFVQFTIRYRRFFFFFAFSLFI